MTRRRAIAAEDLILVHWQTTYLVACQDCDHRSHGSDKGEAELEARTHAREERHECMVRQIREKCYIPEGHPEFERYSDG